MAMEPAAAAAQTKPSMAEASSSGGRRKGDEDEKSNEREGEEVRHAIFNNAQVSPVPMCAMPTRAARGGRRRTMERRATPTTRFAASSAADYPRATRGRTT